MNGIPSTSIEPKKKAFGLFPRLSLSKTLELANTIYAIGEVALYGGMIYGLVAPGWFDSPLAECWTNDARRSAAVLSHTALKRWGASSDLAGAYLFLASDAAAFVTGTVLHVDGGYLTV